LKVAVEPDILKQQADFPKIDRESVVKFYKELDGALQSPDGNIYVHYNERHSYPEMYADMRRINARLSGRARQTVAVYAGKCFASYAVIFTVILSGNTWVPFNPDIPATRNLDMMRLAAPDLLITDRDLPVPLAGHAVESDLDVVTLDDLLKGEPGPAFALDDGFNPDDIAYVMFTSGTTGTPKGVPMTHANYINFINNAVEILPLRKGDVFSDYHDFGFDLSIFYLFCCVLTGGAFSPGLKEVERLLPLNHIRENGVTVLASVPSIVSRIRVMQRDGYVETPIRVLFMCGEPFRLDLLDYCLNNLKVPHVYNFYGLTETGVENFHHPCSADDFERYGDIGFVPIGTPLPGNMARISDEGELLLAGSQLTPGYLGGIGDDHFTIIDGVRWFHSGDRVMERDGVVFCKGRLDWQVKVGGYRIELMDIEAHLRSLAGVDEAICFVEAEAEHSFIVAVLSGARVLEVSDVRASLKDKLPGYMIPAAVIATDKMPLNKSGKIDRLAVKTRFGGPQAGQPL
jgi:acyl-CoA synthetase (AMP-forming)/AMP-acid ligase II